MTPALIPPSATILQVNTQETGGAGIVMLRLHEEYLRRGLDSWVAVGHRQRPAPRVLELPDEAMRSRWTRALRNHSARGTQHPSWRGSVAKALLVASDPRRYLSILSGVEDLDFPGSRVLLGLPPKAPDVLHLHNLHGYYFDLRALPGITRGVPSVLTMHDAWLLTGHCAHPFDCPRWATGCGNCPDLDMYVPIRRDASAKNWLMKRTILRDSRLHLVTPSHWLGAMAEATLGDGQDFRLSVIPNGVDTEVFYPADRRAARRALGLDSDQLLLLTSAENVADNPFKDFATLRRALRLVRPEPGRRVALVALGANQPVEAGEGIELLSVPFTSDLRKVALYYLAADIYVHSTRAESFGLAPAEAMACGIPVVATDVGAIPELVVNGETGVLVPRGDAKALAAAVSELLSDVPKREAFGRAGARRVLRCFTLKRQADAYLDLYAEIMEAWSSGA